MLLCGALKSSRGRRHCSCTPTEPLFSVHSGFGCKSTVTSLVMLRHQQRRAQNVGSKQDIQLKQLGAEPAGASEQTNAESERVAWNFIREECSSQREASNGGRNRSRKKMEIGRAESVSPSQVGSQAGTVDPSAWEAEAGRITSFWTSLSYVASSCHKTKKRKTTT